MKLVKVVFVAAAFLSVSGSAMASVGDFRSTGEELREGQLICRQMDGSDRKQAARSEALPATQAERHVAEAADSVQAN